MPKKRLIAALVVRDGIVVQSIGFKTYLPVGRPEIAARFFNDWGIDEIILLDITAAAEGRVIDPAMVERVSHACFVPLTVGGGIRNVDDVRGLIQSGADKVSVNRLALDDLAEVSEATRVFGSQCIVASIDVRKTGPGGYHVFAASGTRPTGLEPAAFAHELAAAGVGEILLNSIDLDGSKQGFDLDLIDRVAAAVNIPVIALGGAGHPAHFAAVLRRDNVSAAAAANLFHFTEHSVALVKSCLRNQGIDIRLDAPADYRDSPLVELGRLAKRSDAYLDELIFEYVPEEII